MSKSYGAIAYTPSVQAEQDRHGSRRFYDRRGLRAGKPDTADALSDEVRDYLAERDSFYLASVGETGWPYVQYRGGPPGFLRALSDHTIGWADFRGNLQYINVGNLHHDDRVALIVMNYPAHRRLKIYGRAVVHKAGGTPELVARLGEIHYDAVIERTVIVQVEAYDWNCPKHINPRYTLDEIRQQTDGLRHPLAAVEAENVELRRLIDVATADT